MGYNELEVELQKIQAQIGRWRTLGYMPAIEQGLALRRLQKVYAELMELPYGEPAEEEETIDERFGALAPDDESFEPYEPYEPDSEPIGEAGSHQAAESHLRQDDEAHDHCPPQLKFPEAEFVPATDTDVEAEEVVVEEVAEVIPEAETEQEPEIEPEIEPEPAQPAEETHLRQDDEAHDHCPPQLEFPEAEFVPKSEPEPVSQAVPTATEPAPAAQVAAAEKPEPATEKPQPPKPEAPRILGIEVSPYARHEIIDTLFHGNESLFEAETAKIDAMDSLEEALVYVGETYRWIPENAATIKFIDLLESRFEQ